MVADGASANRRFFRLHSIDEYKKSGVTYLAPNVCRAPGDKVYFIADPPHLLKTIRNAWYNSQSKKTRHLIVSHVLIIVLPKEVIPKEAKPYCLLPSRTEEGIKICG